MVCSTRGRCNDDDQGYVPQTGIEFVYKIDIGFLIQAADKAMNLAGKNLKRAYKRRLVKGNS